MSRANYSDDCDAGQLNVWRGAVKSAIRGKRGQAFLQELAAAMDAMPDKRLIAGAASHGGCMCTLAVVAQSRGLDLDRLERLMGDGETEAIANMLGIADAMTREVMFENDEGCGYEYWLNSGHHISPNIRHKTTEEKRWIQMRSWVAANLAKPATQPQGKP